MRIQQFRHQRRACGHRSQRGRRRGLHLGCRGRRGLLGCRARGGRLTRPCLSWRCCCLLVLLPRLRSCWRLSRRRHRRHRSCGLATLTLGSPLWWCCCRRSCLVLFCRCRGAVCRCHYSIMCRCPDLRRRTCKMDQGRAMLLLSCSCWLSRCRLLPLCCCCCCCWLRCPRHCRKLEEELRWRGRLVLPCYACRWCLLRCRVCSQLDAFMLGRCIFRWFGCCMPFALHWIHSSRSERRRRCCRRRRRRRHLEGRGIGGVRLGSQARRWLRSRQVGIQAAAWRRLLPGVRCHHAHPPHAAAGSAGAGGGAGRQPRRGAWGWQLRRLLAWAAGRRRRR